MSFQLTEEQKAIIGYTGDQIIIAGAGTGKTSTLIQKALAYPKLSKVYIAYNKSISEEAKKKFSEAGVKNIQIFTAHALAYKDIIVGKQYKMGYNLSIYGIVKEFNLKIDSSNLSNKIAHHSIKWFTLFCNSEEENLNDIKYLNSIESEKAHKFVENKLEEIQKLANDIWNRMLTKKMDCNFDFYLKLYQLQHPILNYDLVMCDEFQDANPVILNIVKGMKGTKIVVGDPHQAIYGWRGAINALTLFDYKLFYLTQSFRFTQEIADNGLKALSFKENYDSEFDFSKVKLIGSAVITPETKIKTRAILSRSNIGLLNYLFDNLDKYETIHIEGGLESLTSTGSGIKISDLIWLLVSEFDKIENGFVKRFSNIEKLKEYYHDLDDKSIDSSIEFVNRYKKYAFVVFKNISDKIVDKQFAQITFSTIHKSKGLEWDSVEILPCTEPENFPYSVNKNKIMESPDGDMITIELEEHEIKKNKSISCEELNLRYVAITRAKYQLYHNWSWLEKDEPSKIEEMEKIKREVQD